MGKMVRQQYRDENDDSGLLHRMLLEGIEELHDVVKDININRQIMSKTFSYHHYGFYLATVWHMYNAVETVMHESLQENDEILSFLYFKELENASFIMRDLRVHVKQKDTLNQYLDLSLTPALKKYVDRLHELKKLKQSHRIIGHLYTLYMGDLSGGQLFRGNIMSMYRLHEDSEGTEFLKFPGIPDVPFFKKMYRQRINNLGDDFSFEQKREVVDEAVRSFQLRIAFTKACEEVITKHLTIPTDDLPFTSNTSGSQLVQTPPATPPPLPPRQLHVKSVATSHYSFGPLLTISLISVSIVSFLYYLLLF